MKKDNKISVLSVLPAGYAEFLNSLKVRIRSAQIRAALSASRELIQLYWDIGEGIVERQKKEGWGKSIVEKLSNDLRKEFPDIGGFSTQNIRRMRAFYLAWSTGKRRLSTAGSLVARVARELSSKDRVRSGAGDQGTILSQTARELKFPEVLARLPWFHNVMLVESIKDTAERLWYAHKIVEHGWSREIFALQIKSDLFHRKGKAITNFKAVLPPPQSDLAHETLKDPYVFDFLTLTEAAREREVEDQLIGHVARLLLEMGTGFAFVSRQRRFYVSEKEYKLDLLFYHTHLHCYVVVELKAGEFKPEYAGKLNFYLSAADDQLRRAGDQPTIGLLLCRAKDKIDVEYALRDIHKPIGVAEWETKLVKRLPENLRSTLPTVREIEKALKDAPPSRSSKGEK